MYILIIAILLVAAAITYLKFGSVDPEKLTSINMFDGALSFPQYWIPFMILAGVVLLFALWLLNKIFTAPKAIKRATVAKDAARSREALDTGLMQINSGEFEKGEATLTSQLDGTKADASKFIAAARSAEARGASEQADYFLKKASDSSNEASLAVRTTQAEMMMGRGDYDKAETLLTNLHSAAPQNGHIMSLLATTLGHTGNSAKMSSLTQIMRKNKALDENQLVALETPAWSNAIKSASAGEVARVWESLPPEARTNAGAVGAYAGRLMEFGEADQAEALVHKALNTEFDDSLAGMYGDIESGNVAKQLENAERWARHNGQSAPLQATIGKLAAKREMWAKSRDSLAKSAQLDLNPGICNELGEVLESMGDTTKATECFKNAARLAAGKAPIGMMADLPNLGSKLAEAVGNKASAVARKAS